MGMPRPFLAEGERTRIGDVYGSVMRERFRGAHDVDLLFVVSLDSDNACIRYHRMVTLREPDVVILHLGIIDCAPRLFRKGSSHIFLQPWFRRVTSDIGMRFLKKYRRQVTRYRRIVYTKPEAFERNLRCIETKVLEANPGALILPIEIVEVAEWLDERNWGYVDRVRTYNAIIEKVFGDRVVRVNDLLPKDRLVISDGYHLSREAHSLLAERLVALIQAQADLSE